MKNIAVAALIALGFSSRTEATLIELVPSASTVALGDSIDLELRISGLGDGVAPSLGMFDIGVFHDASVLQLSAISIGDPVLGDQLNLAGLGTVTSVAFSFNGVNVFELSLDSPSDLNDLQAGAFTLVSLTYQAIGAGVGALTLNVNDLDDALGNRLDSETAGASVTVQAPEPGGMALLVLGVAAIWRLRRRHTIT